jgi:hypothetical protein
MVPPMNTVLRLRGKKEVDYDEFWEKLKHESFWAGLPLLPWTHDLLQMVARVAGDNWHIVTSPTHSAGCYYGKALWIKQHLGPSFSRFAITPHKEIFAGPDVVLIDDRESTCQAFTQAGGRHAILFPTYHNSNARLRGLEVSYVQQCLDMLHCNTQIPHPSQDR